MTKYSYDFSIIGGDRRQYYLAKILKANGYQVCTYLLDSFQEEGELPKVDSFELAIKAAKNILGPIPLYSLKEGEKELFHKGEEKIPIEQLVQNMQRDQTLFAGCIPEDLKEKLLQNGVIIFDYMKRKDITIYNSIATAEGVIAEAILHHPKNIHGSSCTVLGYGICGKTIVQYLKGMGAHVTVCVRREEIRAQARLIADEVVFMEEMVPYLRKSDFIFNTIPEKILKRSVLETLRKHTKIFDIASGSGGVDYEYAKERGIDAYLCKALPGKYAPKSSADLLAEVLLEQLENKKKVKNKKGK